MIITMKMPIVLAAIGLMAMAADNTLTPADKQAGFRLLFGGHSLTRWRDPASEMPPSRRARRARPACGACAGRLTI